MSLVLVFALVFLAGPLMFHSCLKHSPSDKVLHLLAGVSVVTVSAGLAFWIFATPSATVWLIAAKLVFVWIGWITVLAWGVQVIRRMDKRPQIQRWAMLMGVLCTTAPWFGLASAQMVLG